MSAVGGPGWAGYPAEVAERYRAAGLWTGQTFGAMLRERAIRHPEREAVVAGDVRWTYDELDGRADELAGGLRALGLALGDRVLLQLPNNAAFAEVLLGCLRLGVVPVMALPAHRESELVHLAAQAEAVAIVTCTRHAGFDHAALAERVQAGVPSVRVCVVDGEPRPGQQALAALHGTPLTGEAPWPAGSDLALLQLSGGTTGLPKLIPRTHDDYRYSVQVSAEVCELGPRTRYLVVLPAAHNFPLSSPGILGVLWAGGTVVFCPSPDSATALGLLRDEGITITGVVPPLAIAWLEALPGLGAAPPALEVLQVGGARLDPQVAARIGPAFGCRLQQVFGMAEGLVNHTRLDDREQLVLETQGRPMSPADEVRVVDDAGADVPFGETGHLLTRGPYTIRSYYRAGEADAASFTPDGFYRTGDLVRRLATGHLQVVGRAKEQINRGGEKVAPAEVEHHLLAHPDVVDACVVPLPDERLGERTCAVVVLRESAEAPSAAALRRFVRTRGVAAFKVPDRITFVTAFPTTGVGKVSRRELRAALARQAAAGELDPVIPVHDDARPGTPAQA